MLHHLPLMINARRDVPLPVLRIMYGRTQLLLLATVLFVLTTTT